MFEAPSKDEREVYDPRKRDPKYANASSSPLWEFVQQFFLVRISRREKRRDNIYKILTQGKQKVTQA